MALRHLGFLPSILGTRPLPAPALPHTKAVTGIRGILLRGGAPLNVSARVSLRLLQGQHHFGLFHPAGVQGRKGSWSQGAAPTYDVPLEEGSLIRGLVGIVQKILCHIDLF